MQYIKGSFPSNKDEIRSTKAKSYYEFIYLDSEKYLIQWGASNYKNVSKDTFEVLGSGVLEEVKSNDEYIILAQPYGTGCAINTILPLNKGAREITFLPVLYNNLEKTIIVVSKNSEGEFEIINYKSKKSFLLKLNDMCPAVDKTMCIDSISLNNNEIKVQYQGSKWMKSHPDNKVEIINLNRI